MNSLEKLILKPWSQEFSAVAVKVRRGPLQRLVGQAGTFSSSGETVIENIVFEQREVGSLEVSAPSAHLLKARVQIRQLALHIAPLFNSPDGNEAVVDHHLQWLDWLAESRQIAPHLCDWIGLYFKESSIFPNAGTDLIVGPYLGEVTDHIRIPVSKGICGLAIREERAVNVPDVRQHASHIACSLRTRSELVIPLTDSRGHIVAELDIDSHTLAAFNPELESAFRQFADTFKMDIPIAAV